MGLVFGPTINQTITYNKGKWTPEEDAALTDVVTDLGKDWTAVAVTFPGQLSGRCRYQWYTLDPTIGQTVTCNEGSK
jgi:hypothetical protein